LFVFLRQSEKALIENVFTESEAYKNSQVSADEGTVILSVCLDALNCRQNLNKTTN
jgi:hypothetical protein